ncbi:MAG: universal stress protein, partial [Chloroflexota bacterium]
MASLQTVVARLRGKSTDLLSFDDIAARLRVTGKPSAGRRSIPLDAIVGSVGRYTDFTRTFLPRNDADAQRWAHVKVAADTLGLPPIEVYQIGDAYFVLDGNHRVSIARRQGLTHIEAYVTKVRTRVPLSPGDDPDTLILKTEHAAFLAHTRLDVLRPKADVTVSAAGQYAQLENLIEACRCCLEEGQQRAVYTPEAVIRWYDEAYLPVVETIREQGLLRYFPGRTETDLYVWIATHQAELQETLGWTVTPQTAAANLTRSSRVTRNAIFSRARRWIRRKLSRKTRSVPPQDSWSGAHLATRYSGQLFADLLLPLRPPVATDTALDQALILARRENAQLYGLYVTENGPRDIAGADAAFHDACRDAGVEGQFAAVSGKWPEAIYRRALFADLVILNAAIAKQAQDLTSLLQRCPRPLLLVPGAPRSLERVLLYYDGSAKAREALFAATYMAEEWQAQLVTLLAPQHAQHQAYVQAYLEMHELVPNFAPARRDWEGLGASARDHDCDLIMLG